MNFLFTIEIKEQKAITKTKDVSRSTNLYLKLKD